MQTHVYNNQQTAETNIFLNSAIFVRSALSVNLLYNAFILQNVLVSQICQSILFKVVEKIAEKKSRYDTALWPFVCGTLVVYLLCTAIQSSLVL